MAPGAVDVLSGMVAPAPDVDGVVLIALVALAPAVGMPIVVAVVGLVATVGLVDRPVLADVTLITDGDVACRAAGEQFTLVPARVGLSAKGRGARVVAGAPGTVAAEKGLGPVRGDETIAPGVVGIPMAVVPMVEVCATQLPPPIRSAAITLCRVRMSNRLRH
jgi:hypothetical protein